MGNTHLDLPEEEKRRMRLEKGDNVDTNKEILKLVNPNLDKQQNKKGCVHLTQPELLGIKFIVMYLHHLPHSKKNVPIMLPDPVSVSNDVSLSEFTNKYISIQHIYKNVTLKSKDIIFNLGH